MKLSIAELSGRISEAHRAIRPQVPETPLEYSAGLSRLTGCEVHLKCEHLQRTGSFKFRGASNKLIRHHASMREHGVITASSGNHGLGVALAGRTLGIAVTVYVPIDASPAKIEAIRMMGAQVIQVPGDALAAELAASRQSSLTGQRYVPPYNDVDVIAGQGTIAMEMFSQESGFDAVFVSVGGGGLISGIGSAFKTWSRDTRIVGCWPVNAPSLHASLVAGRIIEVQESDTISDGTAGGIEPDAVTFEICQQVIDEVALVSEEKIKMAMRLVAQTDRWMVEGAAGVALAAMLQCAPSYRGKKIGVVLCGRNISLETYLQAVKVAEGM
ncbi:threonine/serine dehydratase [Noviherbaspirillum malthae]|jgi:threonine dehydratase|uniref:threonine/serine dehydratase n=1 Tax=Noviherbaspirillum malthae TaxID=1260987 RepID=UPI00188DCDFD|nr:threonine/serine dehydratase [Noviherbaspirillum malthae]